jgi:hypothetical protein
MSGAIEDQRCNVLWDPRSKGNDCFCLLISKRAALHFAYKGTERRVPTCSYALDLLTRAI